MAVRRNDRSYTFDPVYRHLLRARQLHVSQNGYVPRNLKAEINRAIELCPVRYIHYVMYRMDLQVTCKMLSSLISINLRLLTYSFICVKGRV